MLLDIINVNLKLFFSAAIGDISSIILLNKKYIYQRNKSC